MPKCVFSEIEEMKKKIAIYANLILMFFVVVFAGSISVKAGPQDLAGSDGRVHTEDRNDLDGYNKENADKEMGDAVQALYRDLGYELGEDLLNADNIGHIINDNNQFVEADPWNILAGKSGAVNAKIEYLGDVWFTVSLYQFLKKTVILICTIMAFASLISIPFISRAEALRQKKEEIVNRLLIIVAVGGLIPMMNFLKWLLDMQFGFMK